MSETTKTKKDQATTEKGKPTKDGEATLKGVEDEPDTKEVGRIYGRKKK